MAPSDPPVSTLAQDHELLRDYTEHGSENAFRALVERHGGMVYGVARRLVGREDAAADIVQSVFLALARKSSSLSPSVPLAGWLHTAARYAASHWLRSEARRREREGAAMAEQLHAVNDEAERTWTEMTPLLDAALASLGARDREAVLLRFFEQQSFRDLAGAMGTTEDAAKMRVSRAVRKLRVFLQRRGTVVSAVGLTSSLAGYAVGIAPAHVVQAAAQLGANALAPGSTIAALATAIGETMRWVRLQRILLITSVVVALVVGLGFGADWWQSRLAGTALTTTGDLAAPDAADALLRDATDTLGAWQATPTGLAVDETPWALLRVQGPFANDYRLEIVYTQLNPAGVVELLLPAGSKILLILLRSAAEAPPDPATEALNAVLGPPQPAPALEHRAEVEVRVRGDEILLSVELDGVAIAGTRDVPAALQRAAMVPHHPAGVLGLGASHTGVVFTRLKTDVLSEQP